VLRVGGQLERLHVGAGAQLDGDGIGLERLEVRVRQPQRMP
jgi:hypothetical protein